MSHTSTVRTVQIKDIAALRSAVNELKAAGVNCDLVQNQVPRMYYTAQHGQCEYVLKLHNSPYDVGFDKQADGSYAPVFDEWNGRVGSQLGASCPMPDTPEGKAQHAIGKLMAGYAKHAAINSAYAQGYTVTGTHTDAQGNIHIEIEA